MEAPEDVDGIVAAFGIDASLCCRAGMLIWVKHRSVNSG
jgi:hypothetical protein